MTTLAVVRFFWIYHCDRSSRGGGVLIAVSDEIPSRQTSISGSCEVVVVELSISPPVTLCCAYVPPGCGDDYYNLIVLASIYLAGVNRPALTYTLVGIIFAITKGVILYHFHIHYTAKTNLWLRMKQKLRWGWWSSHVHGSISTESYHSHCHWSLQWLDLEEVAVDDDEPLLDLEQAQYGPLPKTCLTACNYSPKLWSDTEQESFWECLFHSISRRY